MSALQISDLRVARGRREVLHGVDLAVAAGEVVAVLGPNGAGKSTLIGAVSGTLKPSAGTIDATGRVATLMQTPGLARRSARANVELALAWWGVPRRDRRARATAALERMSAAELARRPAQQLSGGEQRRVHLARALAVAPEVLLLDEPFDGLDPQTHAALRDDTADALRADGGAVVVVLHDRTDAWAVADRIVVLIEGTVQAVGTPRELITAPPTAAVARFLGYDGELTTPAGLVLTRAANVRLDDDGPVTGVIGRVIATEDAARVRVDTDHGSLWAVDTSLARRAGDSVHASLDGAVEFS